jgi:predicted  nucleic acid-binding Zn-ribbon protein
VGSLLLHSQSHIQGMVRFSFLKVVRQYISEYIVFCLICSRFLYKTTVFS